MSGYKLSDFDKIPKPAQFVSSALALGDLPTIEEVKTLAKWDKDLKAIFDDDPTAKKAAGQKFDRSYAMMHFCYTAAELGWTDEQIYVGVRDIDDRWGKYSTRTDRDNRFLIPMIDRARKKVGYDGPDLDIKALLQGKASPATADRMRVYGAGEFADAEFNVDWLLEGLLVDGGLGLIAGYPGTGKTQMCIQIGAHLAQGQDFLIWKNKVGKKKVLFLSLEMGPNALHVIWQTIMEGYEDHSTLNRNFKVYPIGEPVALDSDAGQRWLTDLMDEYKPDVLILDSLQKIVSKALTDEEAAKGLFNYISLIRAKYGCSVLIVHHNRKRSNDGQKKQDTDLSDVFGSTYITTDVDFVLSLQKQEEANQLKVALLKNRFGPDDKAFIITRDEHLHFHNELSELHDNFDDDGDSAFPFRI